MTRKEFAEFYRKKNKETHNEGNIFAPPISGQEAFTVLLKHFLGSSWYSTSGVTSTEQVNMEALAEIIERYPGYNENPIRRFRRKLAQIIDCQ